MIGIVDIDMGNLRSVSKAIWSLGLDPVLITGPSDLGQVSHCILPGVGMAGTAWGRLASTGLGPAIRSFAATGKPVLGICLGMQLLADYGDEGGGTPGLGLIAGRVSRLEVADRFRVPHVGWNTVELRRPHPLFEGVLPGRDFYFVHSYVVHATEAAVLGETDHGGRFHSVIVSGNVAGVQFHPEKSQANGLRLLENFCSWDGTC